MRSLLWVLVGLAIGGVAAWQFRANSEHLPRALTQYNFSDSLANPQAPYLFAAGTWRGVSLANKINTVRIVCDATTRTCDMAQADIMVLMGAPILSLYQQTFKITKLDNQNAVAEQLLPDPCIRVIITFDRVAKAVTYVRTKINKEDICSMVQDEPVTLFLGQPI